jgi:carotenoid 1,2-hydratase
MHGTQSGAPGSLRPEGERGASDERADRSGRLQPALSGDRGRTLRTGKPFAIRQLSAAGQPDQNSEALSGRGERTSGSRGADGSPFGPPGGSTGRVRPRFNTPVAPDGYRWWYVDGLSDDGRHGLSVIAFVGSVFSPYYAWSGRKDPYDHIAINVALYGPKARWAMTERGKGALDNGPDHFAVGPSALHWEGNTLVIDVNEVTVPWPSRLRGQIRFTPDVSQPTPFALDTSERHHWWPYAPFGHIEAHFDKPSLSWQGHGYADTNTGSAALEADFSGWTWSRASVEDGAIIFYEPQERSGAHKTIAIHVDAHGAVSEIDAPPRVDLKKGFWGVARDTRSEDPSQTRITETFVDAPFYTRDALQMVLGGRPCPAVHESLNLDRFASPVVKLMLPFKMPRRSKWSG